VAKCLLAANQWVNRDEGIGMERFCPKPKKAVGGWKAKTFETQVFGGEASSPVLKKAVIDGWTSLMFVSLPLLFVLSEKLSPFCTLFSVGVSPRSGTFVSGVALPIRANFFASLVAQTL